MNIQLGKKEIVDSVRFPEGRKGFSLDGRWDSSAIRTGEEDVVGCWHWFGGQLK